jgi:hypothetical protein
MINISGRLNLTFDDPLPFQTDWVAVCSHKTSWSDIPFNMGDIEDKFITMLSTKILSIIVIEVF